MKYKCSKKYIFSQEDSIPEKDDPMSGDDDDDNDDQLAPPLIIFHELFFGGCLDSLSLVWLVRIIQNQWKLIE